jgi:protoporphyrinogen oxidase
MRKIQNLILGAGLSGLSASYHIGHEKCLILEARSVPFGLLATRMENGFVWDNGPHVSFTTNEYVRTLFASSTEFSEFRAKTGNFFHGSWIPHPAQFHLFDAPVGVRDECVQDFLKLYPNLNSEEKPANNATEGETSGVEKLKANNYREWLESTFGKAFTERFSAPYTRKYWTVQPEEMSCDWVGKRVVRPSLEEVLDGARRRQTRNFHYIQEFRYPKSGGYKSFAEKVSKDARILLEERVAEIDLEKKEVVTENGGEYSFGRLISTLPLPNFVAICRQTTKQMRAASERLLCTGVVLVEVPLSFPVVRPEHWFYVYNEEFLSTRICFPNKFAIGNAPTGAGSVQVEVYYSPRKPLILSLADIGARVLKELCEMGILQESEIATLINHITVRKLEFANVTFLRDTAAQLEIIWSELEKFGFHRERFDVSPLPEWSKMDSLKTQRPMGDFFMAGRFAQWKYFWTDDCVLRGKMLAEYL